MRIKQRVRYAPKEVFWLHFFIGLFFNIFGVLLSFGSKFSNDEMNDRKWEGLFWGTILSFIVGFTIGAIINICFGNLFVGIGTLCAIVLIIGLAVLIMYIKGFGKKARERDRIEEEQRRNKIKLYYLDKNLTNLINSIVMKEFGEKVNDNEYLKKFVLTIYNSFKINADEIEIKYFKTTHRKQAIIIILPSVEQIKNSSDRLLMLGFIDLDKYMRFFKLKANGLIESVKRKDDNLFCPVTFQTQIKDVEEFKKYLRTYSE